MQLPHLHRELTDQFRQWMRPRDQRYLEHYQLFILSHFSELLFVGAEVRVTRTEEIRKDRIDLAELEFHCWRVTIFVS